MQVKSEFLCNIEHNSFFFFLLFLQSRLTILCAFFFFFFAVFGVSINYSLRQFVFFFFLITTSKEVLGKGLFLSW